MEAINIWVDSSWLAWTGDTWETCGQQSVDCKLPQAVDIETTLHSPVYCVVNCPEHCVVSGLWVVLTVLFSLDSLCGETIYCLHRGDVLLVNSQTLSLPHVCHCGFNHLSQSPQSATAMSTLLSLDQRVPVSSPCKVVLLVFQLLFFRLPQDGFRRHFSLYLTLWFKPFILDM